MTETRPPVAIETNTSTKGTSLQAGIVWNLGSLVFLAAAGVALNIVIGRFFGPAALGTFNIAFALYIFFSQFAVFGLHLSILNRATVLADQPDKLAVVVYSGLWVCVLAALCVTGIAIVSNTLITSFFPEVPGLAHAWGLAAPGLVAFAVNKYLLAVLNGIQHMRAFAIYQSLRFILIMTVVAVLFKLQMPGSWLALSLSLAEWVLLVFLFTYVLRQTRGRVDRDQIGTETVKHVRFGTKVMPAGLVSELNTRVDVLVIGALMNDKAAGIYSIAALIFEAAIQAVMVLRNNINPRLGRDLAADRRDEILRFSRLVMLVLTPVLAVAGAAIWWLFPMIAPWLFPGSGFDEALYPLGWLMLALPLCGASLCYSLVLSLAGLPLWQSVQMVVALLVSVVLCVLLIPIYGISGAAMAMGASTIVTGFLGVVLVRKLLGVRLFF